MGWIEERNETQQLKPSTPNPVLERMLWGARLSVFPEDGVAPLNFIVSRKTMSNSLCKISCSTFASGIAYAETLPKNLHTESFSHWRDELKKRLRGNSLSLRENAFLEKCMRLVSHLHS